MIYKHVLFTLLLAIISASTGPVSAQRTASQQEAKKEEKKDTSKKPAEKSKVDRLFDSMHQLNYRGHRFPKLGWEDVPDLMKRIDSVHELKSFPTNPFSSFRQTSAREGMVAAWLIEGIRAGGRYPSLNPICKDGKQTVDVSRMAKFYKEWWNNVKDKKPDAAKKVNPLANTDLSWY